jgi:hypothetical protein
MMAMALQVGPLGKHRLKVQFQVIDGGEVRPGGGSRCTSGS